MILSLLFSLFQLAQQPVPPVQVIDTQSGLSNNIVYETYQDTEGFIWIATDNGLNRYDGYEFKIFHHNKDDSTSISSDIVRTIREDKEGNMWIGTFDGLNLYHKETETFTRFHGLPKERHNRLDLQQIEFDQNGFIWFSTVGYMGWFDPQSRQFAFVDLGYEAFSLAIDDEGHVWSGSRKGSFYQYIREQNEVKLMVETIKKSQTLVYWGKYSKTLWLEEVADPEGFPVSTAAIPVLPGNIFPLELLETDNQTLWIGTNAGLFRYDKISNELEKVALSETSSTLTSSIKSLYQDKNGGVWVGTLNGLFHFDPNPKNFRHLDLSAGNSDVVMGMGVAKDQVYINTLGNNLNRFDLDSKLLSGMSFDPMPPVGFNFIWDIEYVPESGFSIWLATDVGLLLYNPQSGHWKKIELGLVAEQTKLSFAIHSSEGDDIWVTSHQDIHLLSKKTGEVRKDVLAKKRIVHGSIQDLEIIGEKLFFSTEGDDIFVYDMETHNIQALQEIIPSANTVSAIPVWDLYADGGVLWAGSNRGLYKLDTDHWTFEKIEAESLLDRIIFSIQVDQNGIVWMGTERGLSSYDPKKGEVAHFNVIDGVQNTEFNRRSTIKLSNGELWFGGVGGITRFDPSQIQQNKVIPPVHILEVEVITRDSIFYPNIANNELRLPWHQNTLEIKYVALNYTNSTQNDYEHRLTGHDPDWVKNQETRVARYVRLPAGEYSFEVKGSNNDGLWNPEVQTLNIVILPPFWETWWFRLAVLLFLMLVLWQIYQYRVRRLLEVERIKLRIAGDLHDEVGSGLSGIALTGDLLQRQVTKGKPKPELVERITKNARHLASSLDAIVWLIDPKKESLGDLLTKCKSVATELLAGANLQMKEEVPESYKKHLLSAEQKRNLFLLIKEGVHNIAKHAHAEKVNLNFILNGKTLFITLKDNGHGFELREKYGGHGLGSIQSRASELKADLKMVSSPGEGTEITLQMKLP